MSIFGHHLTILRRSAAVALLLASATLFAAAPASAQSAACIGDCNENGTVTVDELLQGVNLALEIPGATDCPAADANGDGAVTVDEILTAVNNLLDGCPAANPTPSPTPHTTDNQTPTVTATPSVTSTPTITVTPTPTSFGPQITFFGLATADNFVPTPSGRDAQGNPVYNSIAGGGFFIVVEARAGSSNSPPGTKSFNSNLNDPAARPDLQIEANRNLGEGSPEVCDEAGPQATQTPGGVPAVPTPNFDPQSQQIANALNDLACRFDVHTALDPCTKPNPITEAPAFKNPDSTVQFCTTSVVSTDWRFHSGDTLLTVQWRDQTGNIGNPARMVVRVP
jgi:hypothetical protein